VGHSEQIVAQALGDVRDKAVYATKVLPVIGNMSLRFAIASLKPENRLHRSLPNSGTTGAFNSEIVAETMSALNQLKRQDSRTGAPLSRAQLEEASLMDALIAQPPTLFWRQVNAMLPIALRTISQFLPTSFSS